MEACRQCGVNIGHKDDCPDKPKPCDCEAKLLAFVEKLLEEVKAGKTKGIACLITEEADDDGFESISGMIMGHPNLLNTCRSISSLATVLLTMFEGGEKCP